MRFWATLLLAVSLSVPAMAAPGDLDPSFNGGNLLKSKRARRAIADEPRTGLGTQASQIAATLTALRDGG